jgi:hypothetical protein
MQAVLKAQINKTDRNDARGIAQQTFVDDDRTLDIYRFATSRDEPGIQISDVIAGLLGESSFQSCNAANLKSLPSCAAASTRSKSTILPC